MAGGAWTAWAGLIYGGTAGMVMAMALWGRAISQLGPQQTMLYVYLEPVAAVVIAAALLSEILSPIQAAGALLTFLGVGLGLSRQGQGDGGGRKPCDGCSHQGGRLTTWQSLCLPSAWADMLEVAHG